MHFFWRGDEEVKEDSARRFLPKNRRSEDAGFIAQEVESVIPDLVNTNEDGDNAAEFSMFANWNIQTSLFYIFLRTGIKFLSYSSVTPYLVSVASELADRLDVLSTRNQSVAASFSEVLSAQVRLEAAAEAALRQNRELRARLETVEVANKRLEVEVLRLDAAFGAMQAALCILYAYYMFI